MKNHTLEFNTLLESLSCEGDSAAFFSRCEHFFKARYQKERDTGASHQDASARIQALAAELFGTFVALPKKQRTTWLEEHCSVQSSAENDSDEVLLDKKIVSETASFLHDCSQMLLRTASHYRRLRTANNRQFFYRVLHSRATLPGGIFLAILFIAFCILFVMVRTETSLTVSLVSKKGNHSFTIPFTDSATGADNRPLHLTTPSDSLKNDLKVDTVQKTADTLPAAVEKKTVPQPPPPRKPVATVVPVAEKRPIAPVVRPAPTYTPPPAPPPQPQPLPKVEPPQVQPEPFNEPSPASSGSTDSELPSEPDSY